MTKTLTILTLLALLAIPAWAARRVDDLPASCVTGRIYVHTDADTVDDCDIGPGDLNVTEAVCVCDGTGNGYIALEAGELNDLSSSVTWTNVPDANVDGSAEEDEITLDNLQTSGGADGLFLQQTGATTFEWDHARLRSHATDCTALTDGEANEVCIELDDEALYSCQPTAGGCDTPAEWILTGGGGSPDSISAGDSDITMADAGAGTATITIDSSAVGVWDVGGLTIGGADATDTLVLPLSNDATTPTLSFGDGDSGWYEATDDRLYLASGGTNRWQVFNGDWCGTVTGAPCMLNLNPSATIPNIVARSNNQNTGLGSSTTDSLSIIAGSNELLRFTEAPSLNSIDTTRDANNEFIIPNGASPLSVCTVGAIFLDTDETDDTNCTTTADNSLCLCTATNTWTSLENN